jgi:hypothetical protein
MRIVRKSIPNLPHNFQIFEKLRADHAHHIGKPNFCCEGSQRTAGTEKHLLDFSVVDQGLLDQFCQMYLN